MSTIVSSNIYGVEPNNYIKDVSVSNTEEIRGIKYPMISAVKEASGRSGKRKILSCETGHSLTKNNLIQFINTDKGQRVMRPNFGVTLRNYLFSNMDITMFNRLSSELAKDIRNYFPNIIIKKISVLESTKNKDSQTVDISMVVEDTYIGGGSFEVGVNVR